MQNINELEIDVVERESGYEIVDVYCSGEGVSDNDLDCLVGRVYADKQDIFVDIYDLVAEVFGHMPDTVIREVPEEVVA